MIPTIQLSQIPVATIGAGRPLAAWQPVYAARPSTLGHPAPMAPSPRMGQADSKFPAFGLAIVLASGAISAYHGYERNRGSIGWAAWWGLLGLLFAPIPPIVALIQGYGTPAKK